MSSNVKSNKLHSHLGFSCLCVLWVYNNHLREFYIKGIGYPEASFIFRCKNVFVFFFHLIFFLASQFQWMAYLYTYLLYPMIIDKTNRNKCVCEVMLYMYALERNCSLIKTILLFWSMANSLLLTLTATALSFTRDALFHVTMHLILDFWNSNQSTSSVPSALKPESEN